MGWEALNSLRSFQRVKCININMACVVLMSCRAIPRRLSVFCVLVVMNAQFIRFAQVCDRKEHFYERAQLLTKKLPSQGFDKRLLRNKCLFFTKEIKACWGNTSQPKKKLQMVFSKIRKVLSRINEEGWRRFETTYTDKMTKIRHLGRASRFLNRDRRNHTEARISSCTFMFSLSLSLSLSLQDVNS
jgi:hypothetical protein